MTEPDKLTIASGKLARIVPKKNPNNHSSIHLPNMPKYQPCPTCNANSKRDKKTLGGAHYNCTKHGKFFVRR